MELLVFLTVVGILALVGIIWNLIDMHHDAQHAETL